MYYILRFNTALHLNCLIDDDDDDYILCTILGYTALHLACLSGHVGVVGLLLSRFFLRLKRQDHIYSNNLDWYYSVKATLSKSSLPMGLFAGRRSC